MIGCIGLLIRIPATMNTWAQRLKLWNWIASAALLFAAIAPALS
jgi:hypothetical protein